jgi:hypothetical protein
MIQQKFRLFLMLMFYVVISLNSLQVQSQSDLDTVFTSTSTEETNIIDHPSMETESENIDYMTSSSTSSDGIDFSIEEPIEETDSSLDMGIPTEPVLDTPKISAAPSHAPSHSIEQAEAFDTKSKSSSANTETNWITAVLIWIGGIVSFVGVIIAIRKYKRHMHQKDFERSLVSQQHGMENKRRIVLVFK